MEREMKKRLGRACLLCLGLVLLLELLLLFRPPCLILRITGFYCVSCGGSRMLEEALRGNFSLAFRQNPYLFVTLPAAGICLLAEAVRYVRGAPARRSRRMIPVLAAVLGLGLAFTVARNLPWGWFLRPVP